MKKRIVYDERAYKDFQKLKEDVQDEFLYHFDRLEIKGELFEPEAKKLFGNLYEVRVKVKTLWRAFYAYIETDEIIILHIFQKQSQKTPLNEIKTAIRRLKNY